MLLYTDISKFDCIIQNVLSGFVNEFQTLSVSMNMIQVGIATIDIMLYVVYMALLCRFESMRAIKKC